MEIKMLKVLSTLLDFFSLSKAGSAILTVITLVIGLGYMYYSDKVANLEKQFRDKQEEYKSLYLDKALADSKLALCRNSLDQQNEAIKNLSVQVVKKPEIEVKYKYITKPNDSCESKLKYYEGIANEAAKPLK